MEKTGLILEGGAMRGMFSAGVMDVMMENGITFDGVIGVSAGAVFGCNFKSGQIGRTIRYNKRFCRDKRYCSLYSLLTTGDLYGADFCYNQIPNVLDVFNRRAFAENPMEFYVVASDAVSGTPVYKKLEKCDNEALAWMRASASMPLASRLVELEGRLLLDGGMTDSIPLKYFESLGYSKNVVVLTQPRNFVKEKSSLIWLMRLVLRKYPALVDAMARRHIVYNEETAYVFDRERKSAVLVICPEHDLGISRTERDPDELQRVYDAGRNLTISRMQELRSFLETGTAFTSSV